MNRFSRRLPIRLQMLGTLGYSDNDYPGSFNEPLQFVDINGNPTAPPVTENPVTGEQSFDPSVLILRNTANVSREYQFDAPYQPESGYWQSIPGVQTGAIPSAGGNVAVVVRPTDLQTTGVLSVTGGETALTRATAGTYVGPLPPSQTTPRPPVGTVLPSWAPSTAAPLPSVAATDDGEAPPTKSASAATPATGKGALLAIALTLALFN